VPSPAGRSLPFWKMWGEVGSLFYERVAREAWNPINRRRPHYYRV
jgi:hypothetical protein